MIWGGRAKAGKKTQGYSRRKKKLNSTTRKREKTQLNNLEGKKSSTQQPERKKILHGLYAGLRCP